MEPLRVLSFDELAYYLLHMMLDNSSQFSQEKEEECSTLWASPVVTYDEFINSHSNFISYFVFIKLLLRSNIK